MAGSGPSMCACSVKSKSFPPARIKLSVGCALFARSLSAWAVAAVSNDVVIVCESSHWGSCLYLGDPGRFLLLLLSTDLLR